MPQNLDKVEVRNLIAITKQRTRAARAEVIARAGAMLAEFERSMQESLGPSDLALSTLHEEAEVHLSKVNALMRQRATEAGIPTTWCPSFTLTRVDTAALATKRRAETRKVAVTRLAALRQTALLEIERKEAELISDLLATQLISMPAAEWLGQLPTAEALMPTITYAAVASTSAAELVPGLAVSTDE